jgi:hypothetical protein
VCPNDRRADPEGPACPTIRVTSPVRLGHRTVPHENLIVVPATEHDREGAWQAKHLTTGINWSKCRAPLKRATEERRPASAFSTLRSSEPPRAGRDRTRRGLPGVSGPPQGRNVSSDHAEVEQLVIREAHGSRLLFELRRPPHLSPWLMVTPSSLEAVPRSFSLRSCSSRPP